MEALQARAVPMRQALHPGQACDAWRLEDGAMVMARAAHREDGEKIQALVQGCRCKAATGDFFTRSAS